MTPTTVQDAASIDPFDLEFLENPHPFHAMLRDAAPVVRLEKYGVYAMARYAEVHAALVDWQSFQSAAGVGLSNFRTEKPWRPPSVLLEADPPRHDAPRAVVAPLLTTRRLRELEEQWRADAATLVAELLERGDRVRRRHRPRRGLSAPGLPRRGRHRHRGPREPAAVRRLRLQRVRSRERAGHERLAAHAAGHRVDRPTDAAREPHRRRLRRADLGRRRSGRDHARAGADDRAIAPHRRRRHDRDRNRRDHARPRAHARLGRPPAARPAPHAHRVRRGGAADLAGADVLPHRDPRPRRSAASRSTTARRS